MKGTKTQKGHFPDLRIVFKGERVTYKIKYECSLEAKKTNQLQHTGRALGECFF
jgi:hypothetical protein